MEGPLNRKVNSLIKEVEALKQKLASIELNNVESTPKPFSKVGGKITPMGVTVSDYKTGTGATLAWNDAELFGLLGNNQPAPARKGFLKHSHSSFSGGALDINILELIEYDVDFLVSANYNKDCQQYWNGTPPIKRVENSKGESIEKKGNLDIQFNAENGKWTAGASEIDVENTFFVKKVDGAYEKDAQLNDKKSALYSADPTKTNVVWDEINKTWRFYAVFAEE